MTKSMADEAIDETTAAELPDDTKKGAPEFALPTWTDGMAYLRDRYGVAMRMWSTKGPKDVGGVISAVFLQDEMPPRVVMLHQGPTRFTVWERVE